MDAARRANNNVRAVLQGLHVISDAGAADASMAFYADEVAESDHHLLNLLSQLASGGKNQRLAGLNVLVNLLEDGDREGGRLASAGLSLRNDIRT